MREALAWLLAVTLAGCGGDGGNTVENNAASNAANATMASAPIIDNRKTMNEIADEKPSAHSAVMVPRGTATVRPEPKPQKVEGYRAIGTEPFWAVTVNGSLATLERPDKLPVRFPVARRDDRRTVRYLGDGFSMMVSEGPCSDGMSDTIWSDRVQIAFGDGTLKGCGGERDDGEMTPP